MSRVNGGSGNSTSRPPDLPTQYEALLHTVWTCEHLWRLQDRLDRQISIDESRQYKLSSQTEPGGGSR